jgi:F-type H+-transporting ATPase subunit gamma
MLFGRELSMESIKEIRSRITSVQKTMKITNAMYLMASSKMKRAMKRLAASEPYFEKLQETITDILIHTHISNIRYFPDEKPADPEKIKRCYVCITSDRGLAGAYNLNVIKLTEEQLKMSKNNILMFIGYAGHNYFKKRVQLAEIDSEYCFAAVEPMLYRARTITERIVSQFCSGNIDEAYVVYTKMQNALAAQAELIRLLPMSRDMFPSTSNANQNDANQYEELYDPSPEVVLDQIVPNYVKGIIYGAMIEAYAAEQNARMTAMKNATDNAKELVDKLTLQYNRVRQAAITTELAEIVGGAGLEEY